MTGFKRAAAAAALGAIATLGVGLPAALADDYTGPPPSVPSDPQVLPATIEDPAPKGESLPFTGADVAQMTLIGAGAVVVGTVAVRRGRRRLIPTN
jgi:hypothetical protein